MTPDKSVILTYHSLDTSGSPVSIAPKLFRSQMASLARSGVPVVSLDNLRETPGSVALTFDDGYRNFFEHALPVLLEHRFPATVFVVTGFCGLHDGWRSSPRRPVHLDLMDWPQLCEASRLGISLGAHTVHHPRLPDLSEPEIASELRDCRKSLEDQTGKAVETFAYPYGAWSQAARLAVSREFRLGCGTELGLVDARSDPFLLPRIDVMYRLQPWWFGRFTTSASRVYLAAQRWKATLGA